MGIFDALTGAPAKRAAEENSLRLRDLGTQGMGFLDAGRTGALNELTQAEGAFQPLSALGAKYGAGTNLYLDSLNVNGADGTARAQQAFQAGPGYQFQLDQGLDALNRRRANAGMLKSGNADLDAVQFGQGLASQEYGNWQNRLGSLVSPELSATSGAATGLAQLGRDQAGVWSNDATNRVGLQSGVTNGLNNNTTQAANAEIAASGNVLGLGMNLAKLAAGGAGGGLFGGFGGNQMVNGYNVANTGGVNPFPRPY